MTERLDRIENALQALSRDVAQLVETHQQQSRENHQILQQLADTQSGVVRLLSSLDEDRPTILQKLNIIEHKIDRLQQGEEPAND